MRCRVATLLTALLFACPLLAAPQQAWPGKQPDGSTLLPNLWRSVRGHHSPMPAPTRATFVFAHPKDDDD